MKNLNYLKLLSVLFIILSFKTHAYSIAVSNNSNANNSQKHFLYVVGYSGSLGSNLVKSAIATAAKYKEIHPNSYHLFIIAEDPQYEDQKIDHLPFSIIQSDNKYLDADTVFKIANKHGFDFSAVHVFSHNASAAGAGLQKTERLSYQDKNIRRLAKSLASDAYIFLHGCNSGWLEAPGLSEVLKVPVWGSFSGTDFEELYDVGEWFNHNSGNYPAGSKNPEYNNLSYSSQKKCSQGHCMRMRPDNSGYNGTWGKYNVGLGFYKQFCQKTKEQACLAAFKQMLIAYPSYNNSSEVNSFDAYKENLKDFLCPSRSNQKKYQECLSILKATEENPKNVPNMSSFKGNSLACNDKDNKCFYQVLDCELGICRVEPRLGAITRLSEQQKEYLRGLEAF